MTGSLSPGWQMTGLPSGSTGTGLLTGAGGPSGLAGGTGVPPETGISASAGIPGGGFPGGFPGGPNPGEKAGEKEKDAPGGLLSGLKENYAAPVQATGAGGALARFEGQLGAGLTRSGNDTDGDLRRLGSNALDQTTAAGSDRLALDLGDPRTARSQVDQELSRQQLSGAGLEEHSGKARVSGLDLERHEHRIRSEQSQNADAMGQQRTQLQDAGRQIAQDRTQEGRCEEYLKKIQRLEDGIATNLGSSSQKNKERARGEGEMLRGRLDNLRTRNRQAMTRDRSRMDEMDRRTEDLKRNSHTLEGEKSRAGEAENARQGNLQNSRRNGRVLLDLRSRLEADEPVSGADGSGQTRAAGQGARAEEVGPGASPARGTSLRGVDPARGPRDGPPRVQPQRRMMLVSLCSLSGNGNAQDAVQMGVPRELDAGRGPRSGAGQSATSFRAIMDQVLG